MMDREKLEEALSELPLFTYFYADPRSIEFSQRIRYICATECPMYGKTWACPPAVGEVEACRAKCLGYESCLVIGTIVEVSDIANIGETLATRHEHEKITNQVRDLMREQGITPYILSTEACAVCERCAYLDGLPCRMPGKMHPCVESHGINIVPLLEENGLPFLQDVNTVTWYSMLFFHE